jgi:glycyl-tRNA synthetase beta chain
LLLPDLLEFAHGRFSSGLLGPNTVSEVAEFIYDRLQNRLTGLQGQPLGVVDAVLSQRPPLQQVASRIKAVRAFAALPEAPALAAANKRISNILKKAAAQADPHVSELLLQEPAEKALYAAMQDVGPRARAQFEAGDYAASLQTLAALREPVDAFFDGVMVNADQPDLRLNRLGLLASLHQAMNRVADLSRLAA